MTLLVKYLPYKPEDRSSIPITQVESWVYWHRVVVPVLGRQRRVHPWGLLASQFSYLSFRSVKTPCLQKTR